MCEYCTEDEQLCIKQLLNADNNDIEAWVDGDELTATSYNRSLDVVKINYCPMCGRNLNEEETKPQANN